MRIFLVRHGESEANVDHTVYRTVADHAINLSPRGKAQAHEAGQFLQQYEYLKGIHPRLWVSPYARTRQTADGLEEGAGSDFFFDRREHILLVEQQLGLFDGVLEEDRVRLFPSESEHFEKACRYSGRFWARPPQGESRFDVCQRIHQAFGTFQRDNAEYLVIATHGTALRAFVMMWCHKPVEWFEFEPNPPNCAIRLIDGSRDCGYIFKPSM